MGDFIPVSQENLRKIGNVDLNNPVNPPSGVAREVGSEVIRFGFGAAITNSGCMSGIRIRASRVRCVGCCRKKNMEKNANGVDRGVAPAQPQATATRTPPATTAVRTRQPHRSPARGPTPACQCGTPHRVTYPTMPKKLKLL